MSVKNDASGGFEQSEKTENTGEVKIVDEKKIKLKVKCIK